MPPRFSPRDWVEPAEAFWNVDVAGTWRSPSSADETTRLMVAHYLSQVCRETMAICRERGWSRADLAAAIGEDPRNVRRKLNGEYPATFEDILRWAWALDRPDVIYAPGRTEDLAPEGRLTLTRRYLGSPRSTG